MVNVGTYYAVRLQAPVMWMSKGDIVKWGSDLNVPFEMTYSCYEGTEDHCGKCPTCVSRLVAFEEAMVNDPTRYTNREEILRR